MTKKSIGKQASKKQPNLSFRPGMKSLFWNIILLIIVAVFTFVFSTDCEWVGDDISYQFICEDDSVNMVTDRMRPVETMGDVVESQIYHYFYMNGRTPVQSIVQTFVGVTGKTVYGLINSVAMVLFIFMASAVASRSPLRLSTLSPWWTTCTAIGVMLMFPLQEEGPLWYPVAMSINYLWTSLIFTAFIYFFFRCRKLSVWLTILAFFSGWEHEAFALALSGGTFFYWILKRREVSRGQIAMIIALWVGTALVVFAPGTIARATDGQSTGGNFKEFIMGAVTCFTGIKLLWIFLLALIATAIAKGRRFLRLFASENLLMVLIFGTSLLFSLYAHTTPRALACVELMSFLLTVRLVIAIWPHIPADMLSVPGWQSVLLGAVLCLFAGFNVMTARGNMATHREYLAMVDRYNNSPDGVSYMHFHDDEGIVGPFINHYRTVVLPSDYWATKFARLNRQADRLTPVVLPEKEYHYMIERPDSFFRAQQPVPGTARLYEGSEFFFAPLPQDADPYSLGYCYRASFDSGSFAPPPLVLPPHISLRAP